MHLKGGGCILRIGITFTYTNRITLRAGQKEFLELRRETNMAKNSIGNTIVVKPIVLRAPFSSKWPFLSFGSKRTWRKLETLGWMELSWDTFSHFTSKSWHTGQWLWCHYFNQGSHISRLQDYTIDTLYMYIHEKNIRAIQNIGLASAGPAGPVPAPLASQQHLILFAHHFTFSGVTWSIYSIWIKSESGSNPPPEVD